MTDENNVHGWLSDPVRSEVRQEMTISPVTLGAAPATALSAGQQIRLATTQALLPEWSSMVSTRRDTDDDGTITDFTLDMLHLARAIETGSAEAAPNQDGAGAAVDEQRPVDQTVCDCLKPALTLAPMED